MASSQRLVEVGARGLGRTQREVGLRVLDEEELDGLRVDSHGLGESACASACIRAWGVIRRFHTCRSENTPRPDLRLILLSHALLLRLRRPLLHQLPLLLRLILLQLLLLLLLLLHSSYIIA